MPRCDLSTCQVKDEDGIVEVQDGAETEVESVEKLEIKESKCSAPEIDEDGFETVKSRRKKWFMVKCML